MPTATKFRITLLLFLLSGLSARAQWTRIPSPIANIYALHFPETPASRGVGFAVGSNGRIFRSADSGSTWQYVNYTGPEHHRAVAFRDSLRGLIGGVGGYIYRTLDGGQTWSVQTPCCNPWETIQLLWANEQVAFALLSTGKILRSLDGGGTFQTLSNTGTFHIRHLTLSPEGRLIWESTDNQLRYSDNFGDTWETTNSPVAHYSGSKFVFLSATHWLASGFSTVAPVTYRSTNAGQTWMPAHSLQRFRSTQWVYSRKTGTLFGFDPNLDTVYVSTDTLKTLKKTLQISREVGVVQPAPAMTEYSFFGRYFNLSLGLSELDPLRQHLHPHLLPAGNVQNSLGWQMHRIGEEMVFTSSLPAMLRHLPGTADRFFARPLPAEPYRSLSSATNRHGLFGFCLRDYLTAPRKMLLYTPPYHTPVEIPLSWYPGGFEQTADGNFLYAKAFDTPNGILDPLPKQVVFWGSHAGDSLRVAYRPLSNYHFFLSPSRAVGRKGPVSSAPGDTLVYSADSGRSWQKAQVPTTSPCVWYGFADGRRGFMAAGGKLYKSADAGQSWYEVAPAFPAGFQVGTSFWAQPAFADSSHGYLFARQDSCLETFDGGETWTARALPIPGTARLVGVHADRGELFLFNSLGDLYRYTRPDTILARAESIENPGLRLFPNPFTDRLQVHIPGGSRQPVRLLDLRGRVLYRGQVEEHTELPLGHLPKGLYFLSLPAQNQTRKVLKAE